MTPTQAATPSPSHGNSRHMLAAELDAALSRILRANLRSYHLGVFVKQARSDPLGQFRKDLRPMWDIYYEVLAVIGTQKLIVCSRAKTDEMRYAMLHDAGRYTLCVYGIEPSKFVAWLHAEVPPYGFEDTARTVRDRLRSLTA